MALAKLHEGADVAHLPPNLIAIKRLRKAFGATEVLRGIELEFRRGEIHAFIGANGAGKSTLLGCLSGAVNPTSGTIEIEGEKFQRLTPRLAIEKGVGIIYQHFQVVEGLTVSDNVFLGNEIVRCGVVNAEEQNRRTAALLARLGVELRPDAQLSTLSVGERQIVEIARALRIEPKVLILDEPTAALSDREMSALHKVVRTLAHSENLAVVYVTHLIEEIGLIADRVTVLRDGLVVWTQPASLVNPRIIAEAIAPSSKGLEGAGVRKEGGHSALRLEGYMSPYTGPIDLDLRSGEIVGIYGLMGSGRTDLLEGIVGARMQRGGKLLVDGNLVQIRDPREALNVGLAFVASDRKEQSLFGTLSAIDNLLMPHFQGIARSGTAHATLFLDAARDLRLHPVKPELHGSRFSGGNAQKLVIGRWLLPGLSIKVLLLDEPTQGVDIGARAEIYRLLRQFTEAGGAVLVSSSDPTEIRALSHRVLILGQGKPIRLIEGDLSEDELVHAANSIISTDRIEHHEKTCDAS